MSSRLLARVWPQSAQVTASSRADLPWPLSPVRQAVVMGREVERRHVLAVAHEIPQSQAQRNHARRSSCISWSSKRVRSSRACLAVGVLRAALQVAFHGL